MTGHNMTRRRDRCKPQPGGSADEVVLCCSLSGAASAVGTHTRFEASNALPFIETEQSKQQHTDTLAHTEWRAVMVG